MVDADDGYQRIDDNYQRLGEIRDSVANEVDTSKPDWFKILLNKFLLPLIAIVLVILFIMQFKWALEAGNVTATAFTDPAEVADAGAAASST